MLVKGIIYMYTSPSGKSYIGQTIDERRRRNNWFSSTYEYAGDAINRARSKYGRDAFIYTVLFVHTFSSKEEAQEILNVMEQYYIAKYDTKKHGYNCDKGGKNHFGYKLTAQAKENISKGVLSWIRTPEGRAKLSKAHKGIPHIKGHRIKSNFKPVVQLSLDGDYIREFPSIRDAEEFLLGSITPKNKTNICAVCNGKRDTAEGYKWLFSEDYYNFYLHPERIDIPQRVKRAIDYIAQRHTPKEKKKYKHKSKPKKEGPRINSTVSQVGQYDKNFNLVKVWRCATEAANVLGIWHSNIRRAIKTLGMYMGYYWRIYNGEQVIQPKPKKKIEKPNARKKVVQMDLDGNVLNIYSSIGKACEAVGANNRALMSRCLNKKTDKAYGYKWKFLECA